MSLLAILFGGVLVMLTVEIAQSSTPDYLYSVMPKEDYFPVHDLLKNETDPGPEDHPDEVPLPDFLSSTESGHRVVEYYAPWCPHCRHFKDQYIKFARDLTALAERFGASVDVHAVSCTVHHSICKSQDVHSFPKIMVYPAGSINGTVVRYGEVHPFHVLEILDIELEGLSAAEKKKLASTNAKLRHKKAPLQMPLVPARSKEEVFADAFLSFDFAMRQSIFVTQGPLEEKKVEVFTNWIRLLHESLPPTWKIHRQVSAIRNNHTTAVQSEEKLVELIDPFRPEKEEWSSACTHGEQGMGYTCGLWELFHVMTVGVVEWNQFAATWSLIGPMKAADALRDYIESFFGCEVCRVNFLMAYDACALDGCNRLKKANGELSDWKQLPLWLWETHNAVNVRLMKERAEREGRTTSEQDEIDVQWPSRKDCPPCWRSDGTWDEELIYQYLRLSYWPDEANSAPLRQKLSSAKQVILEAADDGGGVFPVALVIFSLVSIAAIVYVYHKKNQLAMSGRHKKFDGVCDFESA